MIHPDDHATFQRIIGLQQIPSEIETEYEICLNMFHRAGNSGPLGVVGCINVARNLNYAPPAKGPVPMKVDWRQYPGNGTVRVEAHFFGDWQPGVFCGFVAAGMLAVRLDSDDAVRECMPHVVRLAADQDVASEVVEDDMVIDLTEDEKPVNWPVEEEMKVG